MDARMSGWKSVCLSLVDIALREGEGEGERVRLPRSLVTPANASSELQL